jgi:hypothetical protein
MLKMVDSKRAEGTAGEGEKEGQGAGRLAAVGEEGEETHLFGWSYLHAPFARFPFFVSYYMCVSHYFHSLHCSEIVVQV